MYINYIILIDYEGWQTHEKITKEVIPNHSSDFIIIVSLFFCHLKKKRDVFTKSLKIVFFFVLFYCLRISHSS